jgi:3-deoxy-7-phosphoheptulonate synthase
MFRLTDDLRIDRLRPLIPPAILMEQYAITETASTTVADGREAATRILRGDDDRLLVVAGPCSIHDVAAARDYAARLKGLASRLADDLLVVMRVYFEKPRTTVGWKGLINDPRLDGSFAINEGLGLARGLLLDLGNMGVPAGCEFLDTITPQFIADLVSWGAIGARTTESQVHRELASGLSMPVGFKNGTDGNVQIAVDAIRAASHPHQFLSVTKQGLAAIVVTRGNDACHLILRGGHRRPNYHSEDVEAAGRALGRAGLPTRLMVDCSHGNSGKDARRQPAVARDVADQVAGGSPHIVGVMLESHLVGGRQEVTPGQPLAYGQSITDACLAWDETVPVLDDLAKAVRARRERARG